MKRKQKTIVLSELLAAKHRDTAEMIAELEKGLTSPQWPTRFKTNGCKKKAPPRV